MIEKNTIGYRNLGIQTYGESILLQDRLQDMLIKEKTCFDGFLLLLYHEPVITVGRYSGYSNLLVEREKLNSLGVDLYQSDRGGDITCHEPGQIIIYPLINLKKFNIRLKDYVYLLETVVMDFLNQFDIRSARIKGKPGVWVDDAQIASLGISVKKHCTKHGIAINVNNSLESFKLINPCGFEGIGITSVKKLLKREVNTDYCNDKILELFTSTFKTSMEYLDDDYLFSFNSAHIRPSA